MVSLDARPRRASPAGRGMPALGLELAGLACVAQGLRGTNVRGGRGDGDRGDGVIVLCGLALSVAIPVLDSVAAGHGRRCRHPLQLVGSGGKGGARGNRNS